MSPRAHRRTPKTPKQFTPAKHEPRVGKDITSFNKETPAWQLHLLDKDGDWGWKSVGRERWEKEILPKLSQHETMTWDEILRASGGKGKGRGNNSHSIQVNNIIKSAQKRLMEIQQDDVDVLFSLRLRGKFRIWGIRDGRVLKVIWFDFEHEICPSHK